MQKDIKLNRANTYIIRFNAHGMGLFMSNDVWGILTARRGSDTNIYNIITANGSYAVDVKSNSFILNTISIQPIEQKIDFQKAMKECGVPTIEEMNSMIEKAELDFDLEKLNDFNIELSDQDILNIRKSSVRIGLILGHIRNLLSFIELDNDNNEEKTGFDAMKKDVKVESKFQKPGMSKNKFDDMISEYQTSSNAFIKMTTGSTAYFSEPEKIISDIVENLES